jgi:hypothetical protein
MTLDQISLIAEIIGTVVIILSLVFVGFQIREGSRQTRATAVQLAVQSEMGLATALAAHSDTREKIVTGAPLVSGEERRRGVILYNLVMLDSASRFKQFTSGYLESQLWDARVRMLAPFVQLPFFAVWRETLGAIGQPTDFLALVDRLSSEKRG